MLLRLLILFTILPLLDLWLLFKLSDGFLSFWAAVGLVIGTGILGAALARHQGMRAWQHLHEQLGQGHLPTGALLDGVLILLAGTVLITPGLITDVFGLLLLVPPLRTIVGRGVVVWMKRHVEVRPVGGPFFDGSPPYGSQPDHPPIDSNVIDAEFRVHDDPENPTDA
ncbi:MAG: FxsA family protein [Planctomycetaceae bacterium]